MAIRAQMVGESSALEISQKKRVRPELIGAHS